MPWGHIGRWINPLTLTTNSTTPSTAMTGVTVVLGHSPGRCTDEGDAVMAMGDRISNKAEELSGKGKQTVGDATGNDDLKGEGEQDKATGNLKQAGEKIKDVVKN